MTDADNASTSGQEPTASAATNVPSADRAGYRPQAGDARNDERSGTDGERHSPSGDIDDLTTEQLRAALKATRTESAEFRRKAKELDALKKASEDAQLSESEKLQQQLVERDAKIAQAEERVILIETRSVVRELGLKPEAAKKLIDMKLIDQSAIAFDEQGVPTNITELVTQALQALQDLGLAPAASHTATSGARSATTSPATPAVTPRVPAQSRGAVNPGAGASRGGPLTVEQIRAMSPQEYARNRAEIMRQLAAERGRLNNR